MLLIPQWPFMLIECISLAFFTLVLFRDALKSILAITSKTHAEDIQKDWD